MCLINHICCGVLENRNIASRCLAGAGIITGVELVMGLLLNRLMGFNIWDYSNVPLNLLGQVCLPYSFLWLGTLPSRHGAVRALPGRFSGGAGEKEIFRKKNVDFFQTMCYHLQASVMERCPSGLRS